jgi:ribosomal protein L37AE/L43A
MSTIVGHPELETTSPSGGQKVTITLCSECGELRTILWLTNDRWYCRHCRAEGAGQATMIPISNPARRR